MSERSWDELVDLNKHQDWGTAWLPDRDADTPKTLVGVIAGYDQGPVSEYTGRPQTICTVEDRDGFLWAIWINRTVLIREFERQQPLPGERIVLRYRGTQDEPSRQGAAPAHLYTLTVDRDQALPSFLSRPALGQGERRKDLEVDPSKSEVPSDGSEFTYGQQRATTVDVPDADVVEEKPDDDDIPF